MGKYKTEYPDGITQTFWDNFVSPMVKQLKGNKCGVCGSKKNIDIHHIDYKTEVSIKTLKLFCRKCHQKEHKKIRRNGR